MLESVSALHERVAAHYARVAPLLVANFGRIPFAYAAFPNGFDAAPFWHGPVPADENVARTVEVELRAGVRRYHAIDEDEIAHVVRYAHAIELHSWTPVPDDPRRARFGRILLEIEKNGGPEPLRDAALLLRETLHEAGLGAVALFSGNDGIALFVPVEAPAYAQVRARLDALCAQAVRRNPRLLCTEPNSHASGRVHLHISSNAVGRYSALPYSVRGGDALYVCAPVTWEEVESLPFSSFTADNFNERLAQAGDLFAELSRTQRGARGIAVPEVSVHTKAVEPHGHVLAAALTVLQDGLPRDAKQILSEAIARELLPAGMPWKYVYISLLEYIERTSGRGHRPAIAQDPDRRFRINEPPDVWPALPAQDAPVSAQTQALIDRLLHASRGSDPAAFELAVCDAFAHLGFAATHVGGNQNPDGYADAQLGELGYRVMLECKTGAGNVTDPDAVEAGKYREAYHAQYCALLGPAFADSSELASELQTHGVSAWTVQDLRRLLEIESNPDEMRALFAPGFAGDALADLLWNRLHGECKRVTLVCRLLQEAGWRAQEAAAAQGAPQDAPRLTEDAAMLLVDQGLVAEGSCASVTRDEIRAAFEYMTNPRVRTAVWADPATRSAIVIIEHKSGTCNLLIPPTESA